MIDFQRQFPDESACWFYLVACRWPKGYRCPRCGSADAALLNRRRLWQCTACRYQVSVTAGTVLHKTRTPLHLWFWAAYLVSTTATGISAVQLQHQLGLARYETAWLMLHKLRRAMLAPERAPLRTEVEVEEAWIGRREPSPRHPPPGVRQLIGIGVEVRGTGSGRARVAVVEDGHPDTLCAFVVSNVAPGALVHTDGWHLYRGLGESGYEHRARSQHSTRLAGEDPEQILPRVNRVIASLESWLAATHRGVSNDHLQAYLDEFIFRFNRHRTPRAAFQTVLGLLNQHQPATYNEITATDPSAHRPD